MTKRQADSARLLWVAAFLDAAAHGSYGEAAKWNGADATTVTRRVSDLQNWLHRILLTSDVPYEITQDGEEFLPIALHIMNLVDEIDLRPSLSKARVQPDGVVLVDGVEQKSAAALGKALLDFRAVIDPDYNPPPPVSGKDIDMDAFFRERGQL